MVAAVEIAAGVGAVSQDPASACLAARCHEVDRAFEAIEGVNHTLTGDGHQDAAAISAGVARLHVLAPRVTAWALQELLVQPISR